VWAAAALCPPVNEDKATRYHRLRRRASTLSLFAGTLGLVLLVVTGLAASLRDALERLAGALVTAPSARAVLVVLLYTAALVLLLDLVTFPFSLFREWTLERRYELDRIPFAVWLRTHIKSGLVGFAIVLGAVAIVLLSVAFSPAWWWAVAACGLWIGQVMLTTIMPLLLAMFARMVPLQRPALSARLDRLAARAGTRAALRVYQWGSGAEDSRRAHAALVGFGRTRRVLLSDSLIAACADDEIEVVVAHELAHHVHGDLWKHALGRWVLLVAAFALTQVLLAQLGPAFALRGPADPAAWPLMTLILGAVFVLTSPLTLAWSRRDERRADRYALTLTGNADALLSVLRRLAALNLAEERPSRVAEVFFASHPSFPERVAAIRHWAQRRQDRV
jgi:STE24 endopeptidase